MSDSEQTPIDDLIQAFCRGRQGLIHELGAETYDQGEVLYRCSACGAATVLRDAFAGREVSGPIERFLVELTERWLKVRQSLDAKTCTRCQATGPLRALRAFYGHYLAEVGFDFGVDLEFIDGTASVVSTWRMDARARVFRLRPPQSELDFHAQTGTYFDLRAGWRSLYSTFADPDSRGDTVLSEVQSGYVIGVRTGVPGDENPERRHDPHLEHLISRFDQRTFDCVEFIGHTRAAPLPFHGDLAEEWLGPAWGPVSRGEVELFVLADASEFLSCVEDLGSRRGIAVEWVSPSDDIHVAFHLEGLRLEANFSYPLMRTLHTGRTFYQGAKTFYGPLLDALEDAADILEKVQKNLGDYGVEVVDELVMRITAPAPDDTTEIGRWNLMTLAGRMAFQGSEGEAALLRLLGYDTKSGTFKKPEVSLDRCLLCDAPARVGKVLRPKSLKGLDRENVVAVELGEHVVYYTLECPAHSAPIPPGRGRDVRVLEAAWSHGLDESTALLLETRTLTLPKGPAHLLVGYEFAAMVLETERLVALCRAASLTLTGKINVYAFHADAIVVSATPLDGQDRGAARNASLEAVAPRYPTRTWPLDVARPVDLNVEPRGRVERPS